ncbi:hypothetical protein CUT44_11900 [Streptomyces carminius]|uniref:Uncharacterized protein n=2 Tax=Streptomyces carminius TaxID=2665496 RepID=A0A2M8LZJ7_9ACTN|nr:hypothetical protein CUT44_11900 [Streptomyces carminius]
MASVLVFYADDVHDIIGLHGDFSEGGLSTRPNDVDVDRATLTDFIRGLAEDGGAFRMVRGSQLALVSDGLQSLGKTDFEGGSDKAEGTALVSGNSLGILDRVGAQALEARDGGADREEWLEAYRNQGGRNEGAGKPEEFFASARDGGYLVEMFQRRADRLGARPEGPEGSGTGLHPEILDMLEKTYRLGF